MNKELRGRTRNCEDEQGGMEEKSLDGTRGGTQDRRAGRGFFCFSLFFFYPGNQRSKKRRRGGGADMENITRRTTSLACGCCVIEIGG